jgi:hypothetical protein
MYTDMITDSCQCSTSVDTIQPSRELALSRAKELDLEKK